MMGRSDICNLQFDQVTFPGTHNSGSGFSGDLRLRNGFPAAACVYRNQDMNYTAQLEFGIRWFDIDLCYISEAEATPAVPAGLWTCHSNGYAGLVEDIVKQVDDWMNQETNRGEIVSLFFNGDYDRSRSEPIAAALNELLTSYWGITIVRRKRGASSPTVLMNEDFNFTGQWPTLFRAFSNNERVFVFLHETLQLGEQRWAHDPIPSESPREVIKDSCDNLIDFTTGACNVCTDLWGIDAIGNRGNCIYRTAEICNTVTYNVTRGCLDLRMDYGKTLNVIEVDFPDRAPDGLSVVDIADKFNDLNLQHFQGAPTPTPALIPDMDNCTPAFTPTPSPSPKPRPVNYCAALEQISETPLYYFQCSPNDDCSALDCPIDLFANGAFFNLRVWVQTSCDGPPAFVMEMFAPDGSSVGRVSASETGPYTLVTFPLFITVDQMDDAIGVAVSYIHFTRYSLHVRRCVHSE